MRKKTFVLFSSEPGIAHVTRTLAVGRELKSRGHRVIFAISRSKHREIKDAGLEAVNLPVLLSDGLLTDSIVRMKDPEFIFTLARCEKSILDAYKPNAVLVDFRPSAAAAASAAGVPFAFLTGSGGLPYGCLYPNPGLPSTLYKYIISPALEKLIWFAIRPYYQAMYQAARQLGYRDSLDTLICSICYIVPEQLGYLTALNKRLNLHCVGHIFWHKFEKIMPAWLDTIKPDGKTVYLSFGGTGYDGRKLIDLSSSLIDCGYRVIVSCSNIAAVADFPRRKNMFVAKYLPGQIVCHLADLIICHGGYGTMMQAFLSHKPVVAIPYNPDQLLHGFRVQELGLGKVLVRLNALDLLKFDLDRLMNLGLQITVSEILQAVAHVFADMNKFNLALDKFALHFNIQSGEKTVADIMESL